MTTIKDVIAGLALCSGLVSCGPAGIFDFPVSSSAEGSAWPTIEPLDAFPILPTEDDTRPAEIGADVNALAERAARLRNRAAQLSSSSTLTSQDRARLADKVVQ